MRKRTSKNRPPSVFAFRQEGARASGGGSMTREERRDKAARNRIERPVWGDRRPETPKSVEEIGNKSFLSKPVDFALALEERGTRYIKAD